MCFRTRTELDRSAGEAEVITHTHVHTHVHTVMKHIVGKTRYVESFHGWMPNSNFENKLK